jgi:hypothetical protein
MYFSKLLNNISKKSITTIYKKNNNYNIRQKHILYQLLQDKNNKHNLYKLPPICKNILPHTPILSHKNDTKLINCESITELNISNIKHKNTNNYLKIIIISSATGLLSYSGLYVYLFINNISSLFFI